MEAKFLRQKSNAAPRLHRHDIFQHLENADLTPGRVARHSPRAQRAGHGLLDALRSIQNSALRAQVQGMLETIRVHQGGSFLSRNQRARRAVPKLCALLERPVAEIPWWAAPGASSQSHHPYPGGWLIHNVTNLHALEGLLATARCARGLTVDRDVFLAAMLLHDWAKPRMLLWNGWQIQQEESEVDHHLAALLEAATRRLPDEVIACLAGVHAGWWHAPEIVAGFLDRTAEILDAPRISRLAQSSAFRQWSVHGWIMRQGEVAWYEPTRKAFQKIEPSLRRWIRGWFAEESLSKMTAMISAWTDELELVEILARGGEVALNKRLAQTVREISITAHQPCA